MVIVFIESVDNGERHARGIEDNDQDRKQYTLIPSLLFSISRAKIEYLTSCSIIQRERFILQWFNSILKPCDIIFEEFTIVYHLLTQVRDAIA